VLGGFIPREGTLIQLQYRFAGLPVGWEPFGALVRTNLNGEWVKTVMIHSDAAGLTYLIRGRISAQNGWPYAGAYTNVLTRHVLR
jgi:hypothetical protein